MRAWAYNVALISQQQWKEQSESANSAKAEMSTETDPGF